jgi:hypothetical protein
MSMPLSRTMTVAKRADGGLVVHSVIALDEPRMRALEAFGEPTIMIVPNGWHRTDAHGWKERYPSMRVYCPPDARAKVAEVVGVDGTLAELPPDDAVRVETLDGFAQEGVVIVEGGTLVFGDTFMNQPHMPGFQGFAYRLVGASGGPRVHPFLKRMADRKALAAHLSRLAETPGLARLVPGHGDIVATDAAQVLGSVAAAQ